MADRIHVRDLALRTVIGAHDRERGAPRPVVLNLVLDVDTAAAAASDDLRDAVDYGALARAVAVHVEQSAYRLLEALADSVARLVLDRHPGVVAVSVTVDKPNALPNARSVALEVTRARAGPPDP